MSEEYYNDNPITDTDRDRLNRKGFAQTLAKSILNLQTNSTFTIGLYGAWGCGKTSIVNMIENEIKTLQSAIDEKEKLIIVHFEPWNFSNCDQLLSQFFVRFSTELKKISNQGKKEDALNQIGAALETYSDLFSLVEIVPVFGKAFSLILQNGMKYAGKNLQGEKDIYAQKRAITNMLSEDRQHHNFLIIIDDIDRLSNDQIRQIFQLITSVANFPKMRYLVVFDKEIVVKALSKVQEGSGEAYLEKIIQMPIEVPKPSAAQISSIMLQNLRTIYETYYHSTFDYALWKSSYEICCEPFIKSVRDINRICNSLSVKLSAIASEVNFMDMTALTTIQVVFPPIYDWIKRDSSYFIDCRMDMFKKNEGEEKICQNKVNKLLNELGYSDEETETLTDKILLCLGYLFPYIRTKLSQNTGISNSTAYNIKHNKICEETKFDRYFSLDLSSVYIKKSDIFSLVNDFDLEQIKSVISNHCFNDTISELFNEINANTDNINVERAKTIELALLDSFFGICLCENAAGEKFYNEFEFISYEFLKKLGQSECCRFIINTLEMDDFARIISFVPALRYIEMDFGKIESGYRQESVISESELKDVEQSLCKWVDNYLEDHNLYDIPHWIMLVNLLNVIRTNYFSNYFETSLLEPHNILKFICYYIVSYNKGALYDVKKDYNQHLTKEQILDAIKTTRNDKSFYQLPQDVQNASVAFYRNDQKMFECGEITCKGVKETLDAWKSEDGIEEQVDCNMV